MNGYDQSKEMREKAEEAFKNGEFEIACIYYRSAVSIIGFFHESDKAIAESRKAFLEMLRVAS